MLKCIHLEQSSLAYWHFYMIAIRSQIRHHIKKIILQKSCLIVQTNIHILFILLTFVYKKSRKNQTKMYTPSAEIGWFHRMGSPTSHGQNGAWTYDLDFIIPHSWSPRVCRFQNWCWFSWHIFSVIYDFCRNSV